MPFEVREVDTDDAAYDELIARGFRAVPVTVMGDEAVRGYDQAALAAALERWRASLSGRGAR